VIIVAEYGEPAATCACTTIGPGPAVSSVNVGTCVAFDIAFTEVVDPADGSAWYVARAGTPRGEALLRAADARVAETDEIDVATAVTHRAADRIGRRFDADRMQAALRARSTSPRWDEIAERCLACGCCTLVCPTCFCTTAEDRCGFDTGRPQRRWSAGRT
jgi:sulfhydrogenase subunit beta (sulfur reductase)